VSKLLATSKCSVPSEKVLFENLEKQFGTSDGVRELDKDQALYPDRVKNTAKLKKEIKNQRNAPIAKLSNTAIIFVG
jgi:hypothetical protein